jgi:hypothetical protein
MSISQSLFTLGFQHYIVQMVAVTADTRDSILFKKVRPNDAYRRQKNTKRSLLGCEEVVHGVVEGFQQPSSENFVCLLCPKGGHFLKSRHYIASMLTRPRHGDS